MIILVDRLKHGLELRYLAAKCAKNGHPLSNKFKRRKDSLARDYHSEVFEKGGIEEKLNAIDIIITKIAFQKNTLREQQKTLNTYKNITHTEYFDSIVLGSSYISDANFDSTNVKSSMDYSLYVQYLICSSQIQPSETVEKLFREFFEKCNKLIFGNEQISVALLSKFASTSSNRSPSINDLRRAILGAKAAYWPIFGVDIFDMTLSNIYPNDFYRASTSTQEKWLSLSGWWSVSEEFISIWNSSPLFFSGGQQKMVKPPPLVENTISKNQLLEANSLLSHRKKDKISVNLRELGEASFELVKTIARLAQFEIERGNLQKACKWICAISLIDSTYFEIIDWGYLNDALPTSCGVFTFSRAFVELKFVRLEDKGIISGVDRGFGTLGGVVAELIESLRNDGKDIKQILLAVRGSLPRPAAMEMVLFLTSLKNLERFSSKLPIPYSLAKEVVTDDLRIMTLRLSLINTATDLSLASKEHRSKIVTEEKQAFATRKLNAAMSKGMIRVSWRIVAKHVTNFVQNIQLFEGLSTESEDEELIDIWIQDLVETVLFSGANAVEYLLSANLRHGRVLTAYMSAFTKVTGRVEGVGITACDWHDTKLKAVLGEDYNVLSKARTVIESSLRGYIEFWLTINDDGILATNLKSSIKKFASENSTLSVENGEEYSLQLFQIIQEKIVEFIELARKAFVNDVVPVTDLFTSEARSELLENGKIPVVGDLLVSQIKSLNKQVPTWINVVIEQEEFDEFSAHDIVNLESKFTTLQDIKDSKVTVICSTDKSRTDGNEIVFNGSSFMLINEIVHNLFSNAIKYSGYSLDTEIQFKFTAKQNQLIIAATNVLTKNAYERAKKKLPLAKEKASSNSQSRRRQDNGSGFAKIRTIAGEMHLPVKIRVTQYDRGLRYKVEITLSNVRNEMYA